MPRQKSFREYKDYYAAVPWPTTTIKKMNAPRKRFYSLEPKLNQELPPQLDLFYLDERSERFYPYFRYLGWAINSNRYLSRIQINA